MPATPRPSATPVFELKSAALTLIAVVVKTPDLALLAAGLGERLADTPGLFEQEPVVVDVAALRDGDLLVDFEALAALLREHGMVPVAVKGGSQAQMAAALAAGLAPAPEGLAPSPRRQAPAADAEGAQGEPPSSTAAPPAPAAAAGPRDGVDGISAGPAAPGEAPLGQAVPAPPGFATAAVPAACPTQVIDRPLRSGQQVYARNADLVVMAAVSFGAEVIADGHIHVYGPLRGRAVAGAKGNADARIFTTCMEPQLISIAGIYRTAETDLPPGVLGKPAQVRLEGERLVIEPLAP